MFNVDLTLQANIMPIITIVQHPYFLMT